MVCPFCSEEHPVTLDRCPLTGQPLRPPSPVEALPVPEERARFGTLVAEAARLYRRNVLVFLLTSAVAFVPFAGLQIWGASRVFPPSSVREAMRTQMRAQKERRVLSAEERAQVERAFETTRFDRKGTFLTFALLAMLMPLFWAAQLLSHAALVPLIGDRALGGKMGPGRAWLAVGFHPGAVLWTAALATVATMVGFLFCVLPGVLAAIGFALAMPVVLLERRSGTDALRRSWRLMKVEWPRVLGMWLVAVVGSMMLAGTLMTVIVRWIGDPAEMLSLMSGWSGAGLQFLQLAISLLVFPLPVIGTTLVYLHARREQENIPLADLQLQMQRVAMDA